MTLEEELEEAKAALRASTHELVDLSTELSPRWKACAIATFAGLSSAFIAGAFVRYGEVTGLSAPEAMAALQGSALLQNLVVIPLAAAIPTGMSLGSRSYRSNARELIDSPDFFEKPYRPATYMTIGAFQGAAVGALGYFPACGASAAAGYWAASIFLK